MDPLIPHDVLFHHILPRLPTKSLLRFRCVCKSWDSLIRDPSFLHLRRSFSPNSGHLLFVCPATAVATSEPQVFSAPLFPRQDENAPPLPAAHITTIHNGNSSLVDVQCVNGLLCLHPKNSCHSMGFVHIFNPTTRQMFTLPNDSSIKREFRASTHFGYDPIRDEFKVLRLLKYSGSHEFKIFTMGDANNSWRLVTTAVQICPTNWFMEDKRGVCVNGAIHWKYSSCILAFDLGNEQFRPIKIPHGYIYRELGRPHLKFPDLVDLGGCLTLVGYHDNVLNLMSLKNYEAQEWVERNITLPPGMGARERVHFPLCSVPETGEILLMPYFLARRVRVTYHDIEKMSSRRAVVMVMHQPLWPDQKSGYLDMFFYQESFRSLN